MRTPGLRVLAAAGLVVLGAGAFVVGDSLEPGGARLARANAPVNAGATNPLDIAAHNSPAVARDPTRPSRLVVAARVDTPSFSCSLHASADGGATWQARQLPMPAGQAEPPRCFAPDAGFDSEGTLYVSFVTLRGLGNTPAAVWVTSSPDLGRSFSPPARAAGELAFQVRVAADRALVGRVYLTWVQADAVGSFAFANTGNPVVAARSDDGGATWTEPARVSASGRARVVAPSAAPGPDGRLNVVYLDIGDDALDYAGAHEGNGGPAYSGAWSLVLARSHDGGTTWRESVVDHQVVPTDRFVVFFPPSPSLAVDWGRDRVHVAFHDGRLGDSDVWVWSSSNGGAKFSAPVRVNDTRRRDGRTQYLPRVAVAPAGRLDVVYYDRRRDSDDVLNEVSLQSSSDEGRSFGPHLRLSNRAFDSRIGFGSERGMPDLGSRLGLSSLDRSALAVWADTRAGTQALNKQDLAGAVIGFEEPAALGPPLRWAGAVVALLGLALLTIPAGRAAGRVVDRKRRPTFPGDG